MGVIKKQGISNTIITYIGIVIGFINVIFVQPHFLTTEELGLTRLLYSFSSVIAMFLPLGIGSITLRYFPLFKDESKKHHGFFGLILIFCFVGSLLVILGISVFKNFIIKQYIEESKLFVDYLNYVFPLCLIISLISVLTTYCQSLFRSIFPAFLNDILVRVGLIFLISIYFLKMINLQQFIFLFVFIYGLQVLCLLAYILMVDAISLKIDFLFLRQQNFKQMLQYGLLLSITAFASLGIKYLDVVMIGKYLPLAYAGIYSVAVFIPTIIEAPVGALEKISNAKIAEEWNRENRDEISKIYFQSSKYLALLGGILTLGVCANIHYLFQLLPKDYSLGVNVVLILSISTFFNMITGLNGGIIFYSSYYVYGSAMLFLLLILSVINNMIFIPLYGMEGAAIATALSSFIYNLLKYLFIWYKFNMQPFDKNTLLILLIVMVTFFVNYFIPDTLLPFVNILIHSAVIVAVYGILTYLLKIVPEFHKYLPFKRS